MSFGNELSIYITCITSSFCIQNDDVMQVMYEKRVATSCTLYRDMERVVFTGE